jgi:hypothetical protein
MTLVFQFMLMLVSLYGLNTRPAGGFPPLLEPLEPPEPLPELDPLLDPLELELPLPPLPPLPLLLPLLLELPLLPPLPPPAHWTGPHSAATTSGVHPGSLV